ncbi:MAG: nuclear transport factor 2 family protein [Burkholderiales bacterium]|nr:MAG: nuclear transport factor 2 family protein [Burkholderiales bacterium]
MNDSQATWQLLEDFAQAFNRHDLDAVMSRMTDACVFLAAAGPNPDGQRFEGQAAVRKAFADFIAARPDVQWNAPKHSIAGDRAITEWRFTCTMPDGSQVDTEGLDVFHLKDGKIWIKSTFRKQRA